MTIPKDTHLLTNCFLLENGGDFPEFSFYASLNGTSPTPAEKIIGEKCFDETASPDSARFIIAVRDTDALTLKADLVLPADPLVVFDTSSAVELQRIIHIADVTNTSVTASVANTRELDAKGHPVAMTTPVESVAPAGGAQSSLPVIGLIVLGAMIVFIALGIIAKRKV